MDTIELKQEACYIAKELLESDDDYLEKVLRLLAIGDRLLGSVWDSEFHIFGVISTETDHLPLKKVREHCSREMLKKTDEELATIISYHKRELTHACNEILTKHKDM